MKMIFTRFLCASVACMTLARPSRTKDRQQCNDEWAADRAAIQAAQDKRCLWPSAGASRCGNHAGHGRVGQAAVCDRERSKAAARRRRVWVNLRSSLSLDGSRNYGAPSRAPTCASRNRSTPATTRRRTPKAQHQAASGALLRPRMARLSIASVGRYYPRRGAAVEWR